LQSLYAFSTPAAACSSFLVTGLFWNYWQSHVIQESSISMPAAW
jgi:hypothetical protein